MGSRLIWRIKVGCWRCHCNLTAGSARNCSRSRHCYRRWLRGRIWHIRTRYYSQQRGGWFIGIWMIIWWRWIRGTMRRVINCIRFLHIGRTMLVRRRYLITRFWDIIRCSMRKDRMLWRSRCNIRICYAQRQWTCLWWGLIWRYTCRWYYIRRKISRTDESWRWYLKQYYKKKIWYKSIKCN